MSAKMMICTALARCAWLLAVAALALGLQGCAGGGAQPTATPARDPGYSTRQDFNQSLTIDGVTVVMDSITHSARDFSVAYSYSYIAPEIEPSQMINGVSLTRADNILTLSNSPKAGLERFPLESRIPGGEGELVDVSLGTYLIPANVSGSVTIDLGTAYKTAIEDPPDGPVIVPLDTRFSIGEREYRVAKMIVFPINFQLWIEPANEAARRTDLMGKATLVDNTGNPYEYTGGETTFDDLSPRGHQWRQFTFIGIIPEYKTSLTLDIQGGENIVGPFVFEDVRVVSDEAPAGIPHVAAPSSATPTYAGE